MNVKEIIQIAADLSVGLNKPTTEDQDIYLRYLNLVHFDLYRATAAFNPYISMMLDVYTADKTGVGFVKLTKIPFSIVGVSYISNGIASVLKRKSFEDIIENDFMQTSVGNPVNWYYQNKQLYIYPIKAVELAVRYIPEASVFTINTLESEMPYPALYHQVLVDGISYYLFQGESGLKSSDDAKLALAKFEQGKRMLYAYLLNLSGGSIGSTYSVI